MHDLYRAIPGLKQIHDDDHLNKTARKHYREQMVPMGVCAENSKGRQEGSQGGQEKEMINL